jgi:hypothetical protein
MRYRVHVVESTQATYDIEAKSKSDAEIKANAQDHGGRDVWDTDVIAITGVERAVDD